MCVCTGYYTGSVYHDSTLCVCVQVIIQDLCIMTVHCVCVCLQVIIHDMCTMTVHCVYVFKGYYTGSVYHDSTLCVCLHVIKQDL